MLPANAMVERQAACAERLAAACRDSLAIGLVLTRDDEILRARDVRERMRVAYAEYEAACKGGDE